MGPVSYNPRFAQSVTYLSWMYVHEFVMFSAIPREVTPLWSIYRPFSTFLWMSISVAVGMLIIALVTTDCVAQTGKSLATGKKGFYNLTHFQAGHHRHCNSPNVIDARWRQGS